jgi:plastocyanin
VAATNLDFNLTVTLAPVRVTVGSFFFRSVRNATENPAIDTAKVGQPVRWSVSGTHTVRSLGSPSFASSGTLGTGDTYTITFPATGTYQYDCAIHGAAAMNGRVVVEP